MVLGGTIYSAMDGPGGPLLGGTTYSMTSDVKSARKAKDKLHKACERASETCERPLHRLEQHRMRMASIVSCPD